MNPQRPGPVTVLLVLLLVGCDAGLSYDPQSERAAAPSSAADGTGENVVLLWGAACLDAIRETRLGPPIAARALAIVHTAMFDAWAAYDAVAVGTRLGGTLRRPPAERTVENRREAVSYAAYRALVDLFPGRAGTLGALLHSLGYEAGNATLDPAAPAGVGNAAAAALLAFRHRDGSNQLGGYADYTGYAPVNPPLDPREPGTGGLLDPSRWQPLVHAGQVQRWMAPHWRHVVPFALASANEFRPPPPAAPTSGEFRRQAQELITLQAALTDRQKVIAGYWADGPSTTSPPGHWCEIARAVSVRDGHTLDEDVTMFFLVANAVFDAGIAAWAAKAAYDSSRPITAIRHLKQGQRIRAWAGPGQGTRVMAGEAWVPYQPATFVTPPFAEHVSGHSTYSAASATVLRLFTGSDAYGACDTIAPGSSAVEPGLVPAQPVTLCWPTFSAAAAEAGMSRLYGGIHFRQGNEQGLALGRQVGLSVWDRGGRYLRREGGPLRAGGSRSGA